MAPPHQRRSSSSSSHHGAFQPAVPVEESGFDFANAFWSFSGRRGSSPSGIDDGREGYEALMTRMKLGTKTLEDLKLLYRERAVMEDDHAKKLAKLSKSTAGVGEIGHMERAVLQVKAEIFSSSTAHADLADLLRKQESMLGDFLSKRESNRKAQQQGIEKLWKQKREQIEIVSKARTKYETDALDITGMHARAALSQGRELDKITQRMDKIQQTVVVNERDYKNYVTVLAQTIAQWNTQWRQYCDLCQDQEEERLDLMKSRLWDWSNALSTVAVAEDESAERSRTALEQCDPATDLKIFVQAAGTGNEIPDAPVFVDYKVHQAPPKPSYKVARFPRSSTRGSGMSHSPSAVDDIAKAFKTPPPPQAQQLPQQSTPQRQQTAQQERGRSNSQGQRQGSAPPSQPSNILTAAANVLHASGRPVFAPEDRSPTKSPAQNLESALSSRSLHSDPASPTKSRPGPEATSPTNPMFSVSPNATGRGLSDRPSPALSSSSNGAPGVASASAFQRRTGSSAPPADTRDASPAPAQYHSSSQPTAPPPEDEDDDPINRALNELNSSLAKAPLQKRSFAGPMAGSIPLPGMATQQSTSTSGYHDQPTQRASQNYGRPPSRPVSPAPTASLMRPPQESSIPDVVNTYGQAFPGERSGSRPASRQGSTASHGSQRPPATANSNPNAAYGRSPSPNFNRSASPQPHQNSAQPHVGIGARGRSPSPQPFEPSRSPSRGGQQPWQQQGLPHHAPPLQQQQGYYQAPPQSQPSFAAGRPISPIAFGAHAPASHQRQPSDFRAPSPAQSHRAPSPSQNFRAPSPSQNGSQHFGQPSYGHSPAGHARQPSYQQAPPPQQQYTVPPPSTSPFHQSQYGAPQSQPQQGVRAPSPAPSRASAAAPPPTGQWDQDGKPILFYVNAIYDYAAAGPDEFNFSSGDVIAVTATDPDGWWQGRPVGVTGGGHIFPSNFTELLQ